MQFRACRRKANADHANRKKNVHTWGMPKTRAGKNSPRNEQTGSRRNARPVFGEALAPSRNYGNGNGPQHCHTTVC